MRELVPCGPLADGRFAGDAMLIELRQGGVVGEDELVGGPQFVQRLGGVLHGPPAQNNSELAGADSVLAFQASRGFVDRDPRPSKSGCHRPGLRPWVNGGRVGRFTANPAVGFYGENGNHRWTQMDTDFVLKSALTLWGIPSSVATPSFLCASVSICGFNCSF